MSKQSRVKALLNMHEVEPNAGTNIYIADSQLLKIQDTFFYHTENFTSEEIATHLFFLQATRNTDTEPSDASVIVYPISLAIIASPQFPKKAVALANSEIKLLQSYGRPLIFMSLFDFSLDKIERSTFFEKKVEKIIKKDLKLHRLNWIRPCDKIVQFECTVDLDANCTVFPLTLTPTHKPTDNRRWLLNFVGQTTKSHWPEGMVRSPDKHILWQRITERILEKGLIGNAEQAKPHTKKNPYFDIPANSTFTLCPRGIGNWTFRLYEAIISGSIPVILSDSFIPPFPGLDWNSFSIRIPESQLCNVDKILLSKKSDEIKRYQENLQKVQNRFNAKGLQRLWLDWLSINF